jgi:hypothetical protein
MYCPLLAKGSDGIHEDGNCDGEMIGVLDEPVNSLRTPRKRLFSAALRLDRLIDALCEPINPLGES